MSKGHGYPLVLYNDSQQNFHSLQGRANKMMYHKYHNTLEISVKLEKNSTNTLSLVIHRVRFKKNLQERTLAFKRGAEGGNSGNRQF